MGTATYGFGKDRRMTRPFPTTISELSLRDDTVGIQSLYHSIRDLRKATLSIPNRLRSILEDADFVQRVVEEYSHQGSPLPVIANERCGNWYIPPDKKAGSAYFKSTDGHFGQWDFSLRRLNLQVLEIVASYGGAVIVDSTRRGKSMPDAFSKTVPIWVAVMNSVLFPDMPQSHKLQVPPDPYSLSESEVSQIRIRLEGFAKDLCQLNLNTAELRNQLTKPTKLFWVADHFTSLNSMSHDGLESQASKSYLPMILCSASRRVRGAEMSEGQYVQGAGDDSEGWSRGLTPRLFWQHKDLLLHTREAELEVLIQTLVSNAGGQGGQMEAVRIAPTSTLHVGQELASSNVSGPNVEGQQSTKSLKNGEKKKAGSDPEACFDMTINCSKLDTFAAEKHTLNLACRSGKLGSRDLRAKLESVKGFARRRLSDKPGSSILVTCETGKDLSVGVALMLLCLFYDESGKMKVAPDSHSDFGQHAADLLQIPPQAQPVDKSFIRQRLAWVISSQPSANPSRSTLQSVNAFLIARPE